MRIINFLIIVLCLSACGAKHKSELSSYTIPEGFQLEIISMEPDIHAPVNIDFDNQGRIWVVEMTSYMPNIEGTGEKSGTNKIKILEDTDGDGIMDDSKVFMDQLNLPRSLLHAYGGLVYSEPPNLWHVEIVDDKPGKRTLIDSTYAMEGNVEHMPSALTLNIDNWIYSSTCNARYKRINGEWIKSFTTPRGQWGMTRDNFGRLLYNNNGNLLKADRVLPNAFFKNEYLKLEKNIGENCTESQAVFPIQATAVNRGYQDGVLSDHGFLINTTSACSPLYYRNKNVASWNNAAFVCLPEINAIKKLDIEHNGWDIDATFEHGSEYLISKDEGFRPVDLKVGPDGSIYIADMHRGIIQHKAYMTSYLREKILKRKLDTITEMGRILRLSPNENKRSSLAFNISNDPLKMLYSDNAFLRDKAQHFIVHNSATEFIDAIKEKIKTSTNEIHLLHSIWTLEGLGVLDEIMLITALEKPPPFVKFTAAYLLSQMKISQKEKVLDILLNKGSNDDFIMIGFLKDLDLGHRDFTLLNQLMHAVEAFPEDAYRAEAYLSNLGFKEEILDLKNETLKIESEVWEEAIESVHKRALDDNPVYYYNANIALEDRRTVGMSLYRTYCASCHGVDGEGIADLAPSLIDSEYVTGSEDRLVLLTLHGLSGPITRDGKKYRYNGEMAGVNNNDDLSDEDVKDILHFVRNAFGSAGYTIADKRIKELRSKGLAGGEAFTEGKLDSIVKVLARE